MKKLIIANAIAMLTLVTLSCSKESVENRAHAASSTSSTSGSGEINFTSPWFTPQFTLVSDRGSHLLMARHDHGVTLNYDQSIHVALAWVKLSQNRVQLTKKLPVVLSTGNLVGNESAEIDFGADHTCCIVTLKNADRYSWNVIIDNPFPDMQMRYIIITKSKFDSLNIDWSDYAAVAQALNI